MSGFLGTLIVAIILAAIIGLVIYSMVKDKKQGKHSCGGTCGCCPNSSLCHGGGQSKQESKTSS